MNPISKLHYITTGPELAEKACRGGISWIQLRLKDIPYDDYRSIAREVQAVCKTYRCTFIINDNVELALELRADGVHIGKEDMPPDVARALLKDDFIIGATANTLNDIVFLAGQPIDYIGLGPFRFTTTKKKLSPVLGAEGYKTIFHALNAMSLPVPPVVAIGGITEQDISVLAETGVHGVAVSGSISGTAQLAKKAGEFVTLCEQHF
jgi:thiamine-phosphate pyrophosphorylase